MKIRKRIEALEAMMRHRSQGPVAIIAAEAGESSEDVMARYVADHGPLPISDRVNLVVLIGATDRSALL